MKKLLSLLLSFIVIFCSTVTTSAAQVEDVPTSVSVMQQLGYIEGDENGNLNLNNQITRAEFCAMLVRVLDLSANGYSTSVFADVDSSYWGYNYILSCYNLGIINGHGDGTFKPDDIVTYEQAVKMVVCALGYEPMAKVKGNYPTGYLAVANQIKITDGVINNTRKDIITLVYNAISTPQMGQTSYGSETKYEPLNDKDNYTTILTSQDIYVATGIIGDVNVVDGVFDFEITEDSDDFEFKTGNKTFEVGTVNIDDYKNENVSIYLKKVNRNKYTAVAIEPASISETLVINASDLETVCVGGSEKWEYYENINSTKITKIDVDKNASIYVNGNKFNADNDYFKNLSNTNAVIKFIENNDKKGFDVVNITVYEHAIVEEVYPNKGRIECLNSSKIAYDIDDEDVVVNIYDINGYEIDLDDINAGDVLAIVVGDLKSDGAPKTANSVRDNLVIYNLGNNSIEGTINKARDEENVIYIDNVSYEYNNDLVSEKDFFKDGVVKLGTEGVFYFGIDGKVIGFDGVAGASNNYAFVLQGAKDNSAWDDRYQLKLLLADGSIKTYYVDEDIKNNFDIEKWTKGLDVTDRVVEYKVNSKGVIIELEFINGIRVNNEYKEKTSKIDGKVLAADVVIFNVDVTDAEDASVVGIDYLVDEGIYGGYVMAKDDEYEVFVMTSGAEKFDAEAPLYVVDSVVKSTYGEDKDACYEVTYYNGEEKEIAIFTADSEKYNDISLHYNTLQKGSIFVATSAANGLVNKYMVIANVKDDDSGYDIDGLLERFEATYNDEDVSYEYAQIKEIDKKYITLNGVDYDIVIDAGASQYYYNAEGSKPKLEVGDWYGDNVDEENNNYVFVKLYEDEVTDIIVFSTIN